MMNEYEPLLPAHWENVLPLIKDAASDEELLNQLKNISQEDYDALLASYEISDDDVNACRSDFALYFSGLNIEDWHP